MNEELKNIFLAEAQEQRDQLNKLFTDLEKNQQDISLIEAIFRLTHTLKANAAAMGIEPIAEMAHLLEDIFSIIKKNTTILQATIFNDLFRANDKIGELIESVAQPKEVNYKGLSTRLKVILRELHNQTQQTKEVVIEKIDIENNATNILSTNPLNQEIKENSEKDTTKTEANSPFAEANANNANTQAPTTQVNINTDIVAIPVKKLDNLLNLVEELSIEKDFMVSVAQEEHANIKNEFTRLQRITSDLQYAVMNIRLVQVNTLFQKFYRIVRDTSKMEGKEIDLILQGTEIEIDRNILQIIGDSMVHLVRNAVSHGIESPDERKKLGKNSTGTILLKASAEKNNVIIEVTDDGKGIAIDKIKAKIRERKLVPEHILHTLSQEDLINFIFEAGFSSAEKVTAVSGRGVGMDVVRKSVESVGGKISVITQTNEGTSIRLHLPASMALKPALLLELNQQVFAIPINYTEAVITKTKEQLFMAGKNLVTLHLDKTVPIIFLKDLFDKKQFLSRNFIGTYQQLTAEQKNHIIVVTDGLRKLGIAVDKLLHQKEIIEKQFKAPLKDTYFMSGVTVIGNGSVCLVIDIPSIMNFLFKNRIQIENQSKII